MIFALPFSDYLETWCGDHDSSKAYFNWLKEAYSRWSGHFLYAGKFNGKPYYKFGSSPCYKSGDSSWLVYHSQHGWLLTGGLGKAYAQRFPGFGDRSIGWDRRISIKSAGITIFACNLWNCSVPLLRLTGLFVVHSGTTWSMQNDTYFAPLDVEYPT